MSVTPANALVVAIYGLRPSISTIMTGLTRRASRHGAETRVHSQDAGRSSTNAIHVQHTRFPHAPVVSYVRRLIPTEQPMPS